MTLAGIRMRVVGRDATPMRGRDGTDTSYETETINIGPGESYDVIFTAPAFRARCSGAGYDTYLLYNRAYERVEQPGAGRLRRPGDRDPRLPERATVGPQNYPNDWGM